MSTALVETKQTAPEDGVQQYLQEIRMFPRLTPEQELELAQRIAKSDEDAIRQMVNSNLRLVVSVAKEYAWQGIPLLDLIQEGSIGLLTAAKRFDYTQQCRFSTYATKWIRQGISRYILNHKELIYMPRHTAEQMQKLQASRAVLLQQLGREPEAAELADHSGLPVEKVCKLQQLPQICSLNAEAEDTPLQALLENVQAPQPQQELVRQELKRILETLLQNLTSRQQQVLRLHFGMEDGQCYSLEQIGQKLGISKERARQIEVQAMKKLQTLGTGLGLEDFLESDS